MRKVFTGVTALLTLAVIGQFFLAGRGAFSANFDPHRGLGYVTIFLSAAVLLVGALARMPGRILGMFGLVVGLLVLQPMTVTLAEGRDDMSTGGLVLGLHAVNGAVILGILMRIIHTSRAVSVPAHHTAPTTARS